MKRHTFTSKAALKEMKRRRFTSKAEKAALLVNLRRFISVPDLFPLAPTNRPGSPRMTKYDG